MSNQAFLEMRDNAMTKISDGIALNELGKKLFLNESSLKLRQQGYDLMKAGCKDYLGYLKQEPDNELIIISKSILQTYVNELESMNKILYSQPTLDSEIVQVQKQELEYTQQELKDSQQNIHFENVLQIQKHVVNSEAVIGLEDSLQALKEALILPFKFPELFVGSRRPDKTILLYGPPGTGKTQLIKACAAESEATLCTIQMDELLHQNSEKLKLMRGLIQQIKQEKNIIILIKKIDFCQNFGQFQQLLKQLGLDSLFEKNEQIVFFVGVTSSPWKLETFLRRKFMRRVKVSLLDSKQRLQLIQEKLRILNLNFTQQEFQELATVTEGFSGSDINNFIFQASLEPQRRLESATFMKFDQISQKYLICSSDDPNAEEIQQKSQIILPQLIIDDFFNVLQHVKPTITQQELKQYEEWTSEFS